MIRLEQPIRILIAGDQHYKIDIQWESLVTDGDLLMDVYIPTHHRKQVLISVYRITESEYHIHCERFASMPHIEEIPVSDSSDIINPYLSLFPATKLTWVDFMLNFLKHKENNPIPTDPTGFIP